MKATSDSSSKWRRFVRNPRAFVSLVLLGIIFLVSLVGGFFLPDSAAIVEPDTIKPYRRIQMRILPDVKVGRINLRENFTVASQVGCEDFSKEIVQDAVLTNAIALPSKLISAIEGRFANQESPEVEVIDAKGVSLSLLAYKPRTRAPKTVRLRIRDMGTAASKSMSLTFVFNKVNSIVPHRISRGQFDAFRKDLKEESQVMLFDKLKEFAHNVAKEREGLIEAPNFDSEFKVIFNDNTTARVLIGMETVAWPFRPVPGHPLGIDSAGRDLLSRIVAGTRIALLFGLVLVVSSMIIGIAAGAVQGYYGGLVDIGTQRFIEIWSSLPFLYVMILVGSVFGRSFALLLFCYGLFNWIGISYYMRAEFLRLRSRPFVEAARCQGLSSWRIIWRHILPNALTPIVTLLPFSLIGAISSISALDFLGFGLPPLTPSLGELLGQAQLNASAWWLTLYPSLVLFSIMLLAVFVGEGLRDAFDPKPSARYQ